MSEDEALDLALEALELSAVTVDSFGVQKKTQEAITALKQVLALDKKAENARELGLDYEPVPENFIDALKFDVAMRDATPVQEPVANASAWFALVMNAAAELEDASHCLRDEDAKRVAISGTKHYRDAAKALYTTPPAAQRQWVGLTDDEFEEIELGCRSTPFGKIEAMEKVEAKLKEKNT